VLTAVAGELEVVGVNAINTLVGGGGGQGAVAACGVIWCNYHVESLLGVLHVAGDASAVCRLRRAGQGRVARAGIRGGGAQTNLTTKEGVYVVMGFVFELCLRCE
jgi:hypothetical protein